MTAKVGFSREGGELLVDGHRLAAIAERHGTPTYVYSAPLIRALHGEFSAGFAKLRPEICYAVKACSNLSVLRVFAGLASYPLALVGALGVGLLESFGSFWSSPYKEVIVFSAILPVLLWRSLRDPHSEEH